MNTTLDNIVRQAVRNAGDSVMMDITPRHEFVIDYLYQYNETDFEFLNRLSWIYGESLYYTGTTLKLGFDFGDPNRPFVMSSLFSEMTGAVAACGLGGAAIGGLGGKIKLKIYTMLIIYQVTSQSSICLKQVPVYEETVTQQWQISYQERLGAGFLLTIEMLEKPATNSSDMKPLYSLFDIINEAMQTIVVSFNRFDQLDMLENSKELIMAWEKSKQKISDKFGEDKSVKKILDETEFNFYNFRRNILGRSVPYNMLLSSLCAATEYTMDFKSILHEDDNVQVKVNRSGVSMQENGKTHYCLKGNGQLGHLSKLEKQYTQNILPFLPDAAFEYSYLLQTDYTFAGDKSLFFERAVTHITEQASQDYVYHNQIIIEQMGHAEKEEGRG